MASIISAGTTSGTALNMAGDTSGVLQLATNGSTTALTIDTSQNVGIGTSSLSEKLTVNTASGNSKLLTTSGSNAVYMGWDGTDAIGEVATNQAWRVRTGSSFTERMRIDSSGNVFAGPTATQNGATGVIYSKTTAKAWVTFFGNTATILSSFNVSSVTRASAGQYTVTFTSAMPNANYSSFYMAQPTVSNAGSDTFTINPTTTAVQCNHWEANTPRDSSYSCVVVFGSA